MLPVLNLTPTLSFWAKNGEFLLKGEKNSRVFAIAFCSEQILHFRSERQIVQKWSQKQTEMNTKFRKNLVDCMGAVKKLGP